MHCVHSTFNFSEDAQSFPDETISKHLFSNALYRRGANTKYFSPVSVRPFRVKYNFMFFIQSLRGQVEWSFQYVHYHTSCAIRYQCFMLTADAEFFTPLDESGIR